ENAVLSKIPYSPQAFFDTDLGIQYACRPCTPGTRVQVLEEIKAWAMSSDTNSPSAYWISGMAGTGKSTIAMSTCQILRSQNILAGSFFALGRLQNAEIIDGLFQLCATNWQRSLIHLRLHLWQS
ncbi:hypothetical protein GYMLUDRAFT_935522, partial [Collybiopsis luxurians FD-317 M1]